MEAYRRSDLVAETPCGNRHLCSLVGVVLADPVLDHFADFGSEFAREISLALCHKPIVVIGARISLSAQGIERRDELSLRIDRELQSFDRAVVHLLRAGVDLVTISHWLGHASVETTNRYAAIDLETKREALQRAGPVVGAAQPEITTWRTDGSVLAWLEAL